jgi:hypothetical protein
VRTWGQLAVPLHFVNGFLASQENKNGTRVDPGAVLIFTAGF